MEQQLAGRIKKELEEVLKDTTSGITITQTSQDSLKTFMGVLPGPKDTVYEGGIWRVDISLPKNYPFEPPKMKFITPLWHPNISSQTGAICELYLPNPGLFPLSHFIFGVCFPNYLSAATHTFSHQSSLPTTPPSIFPTLFVPPHLKAWTY